MKEAVQRDECLVRAAALLQCPEADGRISSYGQDTLQRIRAFPAVKVVSAAAPSP
jgi:hypothetical protein